MSDPQLFSIRVGQGYDIHRLQPGGQLVLGNVVVDNSQSPIAHSDGDVAIHALVDALLGALGAGDIGEHFPPADARWKNADSALFLNHSLDLVRKAGFRVINADLTILALKPHLKPFKLQIKARLQELLNAPVNIKAGTNEECGEIGRGEAIAALAVVLLGPK